ncbi:MAG: DUF4907 domain-containing protein [Chitinophagaceae bacterium]|nr:DUF4907 domain-containing protein [Chitinophagaceae bacterium]
MKISKRKFIAIILLLAVAAAGSMHLWQYYIGQEKLPVEVRPFKVKSGWGYDIIVDEKMYIHQETIPSIPGNQVFQSKEDAIKTGNLAMKKLVATGRLPSLSKNEIIELGIAFVPADQR